MVTPTPMSSHVAVASIFDDQSAFSKVRDPGCNPAAASKRSMFAAAGSVPPLLCLRAQEQHDIRPAGAAVGDVVRWRRARTHVAAASGAGRTDSANVSLELLLCCDTGLRLRYLTRKLTFEAFGQRFVPAGKPARLPEELATPELLCHWCFQFFLRIRHDLTL